MSDITPAERAIAAAMRAEVDASRRVYAVANRWVTDSLHVHLSRDGRNRRVELSDEPPLAADEAHAWAAALGAPEGTPVLRTWGGRVWIALWEDDPHEPVPDATGRLSGD